MSSRRYRSSRDQSLALVILGAFLQAAHQRVGRCLEVDDEIGRGHVFREELVQALVDEQFVVIEVEAGEDLVLVEEIVGNRRLREQIGLAQRQLLSMSAEQIEELRLQCRTLAPAVEVG